MSKRNAAAVLSGTGDSFYAHAPAGAFRWTGLPGASGIFGINFGCPCGCGRIYGASFDNRTPDLLAIGHKQGQWHWDGNRDKPTLTPSLGLHAANGSPVGPDGHYHWHGFLRNGVFEEC